MAPASRCWACGAAASQPRAFGPQLVQNVWADGWIWYIGPLLGGAYGAIAGLPLGIMEGAVLWAFTLYFYRGSKPGDNTRHLRRARYVCAGACVLVPLPIIEFLARRSGPSLVTGAYDSSDVIMLLIVLLIPTFIAASAVWWAVKRVAARFIREVGEQVNPSPGQTIHGGSIETGLNQ